MTGNTVFNVGIFFVAILSTLSSTFWYLCNLVARIVLHTPRAAKQMLSTVYILHLVISV